MRKNHDPQAGGFNPRIFPAFILFSISALLAMWSFSAPTPNLSSVQPEIRRGELIVPSEFRGDVRNLPQYVTPAQRKLFIRPLERDIPLPSTKQVLPGARLAAPTQMVQGPLAPMPTPASSFNGMNFNANGAGHPPDTVGDVGPNHFVQAVNTSVGIYNKTTGAALATFTFDALWVGAGTGTSCDTFHGGDPTVIYVPQYDRFIVAD